MELLALFAICIADWGCAASHMAYVSTKVPWYTEGGKYCGVLSEIPLKRLPFYDRRIPIWGDVYHLIAGLRYLPMALLAWLAFGNPFDQWRLVWYGWDNWPYWYTLWYDADVLWYIATASINGAGWQILKRVHGKDWTLKMLWGRVWTR